jgi:hypothetical protein
MRRERAEIGDCPEWHEVKRSVYRRPCLFEAENAVWVGVLCLIFMPFVTVPGFPPLSRLKIRLQP